MEEPEKRTEFITVEIYDQIYHLAGQDPDHIRELAARVDAKMRAVAAQGRTVDSLRVAVLAALNLADELSQACAADPNPGTRAPPPCADCSMKFCRKTSKRAPDRSSNSVCLLVQIGTEIP